MNSASTLASTVQAIAEMLGYTISKPTVYQTLAQDTENILVQYIRSASVLANTSRSSRLSAKHLNRVLASESLLNPINLTLSDQKLQGYENYPTGQYNPIPFEQSELYIPREDVIQCKDIISSEVVPFPSTREYEFQFLLTEGVYADTKMLSNRRLIVKAPKQSDRSSNPSGQSSQTQSVFEFFKSTPVHITKINFEQQSIVKSVLNHSLQLYYAYLMNLIRDDMPLMKNTVFLRLEQDVGLQQLIPYFLQYIIGNMIFHFRNVDLLCNLLQFTKSIIKNPSLCSSIYVHPFLKIVFSGLVGSDYTSELHGDDTKLREISAEVLKLIVDKYSDGYPSLKVCVFNSLVSTLFDPNTTLMAHYGALCGIDQLFDDNTKHVIPHLSCYIQLMNLEMKALNARQHQCAHLVCTKVKEIIQKNT